MRIIILAFIISISLHFFLFNEYKNKKISEVQEIKEEKNEKRTEIDQKTETARKKISGLLINLINKIKYLFILVAEKTVKKAKATKKKASAN